MRKTIVLLIVVATLAMFMVGCGTETVEQTTVAPVTEEVTQAREAGVLEDIPSYNKTQQTVTVTEVIVDTTITVITQDGEYDYVLNTNTMKFHYPECSSVEKIKEENMAFLDGTREDAIEQGFDPCGNCEP